LTIIEQKFYPSQLGLVIFVGINEYGEEIIEFLEPEIKLDLFYYSCSNKFSTHIITKYFDTNIKGTIVFVNGDETCGYQFKSGQFVKIFGLNGNLVKRHSKGGYSANRFARLAEESRHLYIIRICDRLRNLLLEDSKPNIHIFGSEEIVQMTIRQFPTKIFNGGFLNWNHNTIKNSSYWIKILSNELVPNYDSKYKDFIYYLSTDPDMLDFDPVNCNEMDWFIDTKISDKNKFKPNQIPLDPKSEYFNQLIVFGYIGVKYYIDKSFYEEKFV
jgi:hypothetical protein